MARKKGHAHHGGAWKVAYADFVTAMMALFLVLWLTSQDEKIKEAVERSFRNPFMSVTKDSTGLIPNKDSQAVRNSTGNFDSASAVELNMLRKMFDELVAMMETTPEILEEQSIKLDLQSDGVRINVFDRARKPVFEADNARFTPYGQWLFTTLAWNLSRFTNTFHLELEGHTERGRPPASSVYGGWEISTDRANSARRMLIDHGVGLSQVRRVAGYADTKPMQGTEPEDETNRRVTVLLKFRQGLRFEG